MAVDPGRGTGDDCGRVVDGVAVCPFNGSNDGRRSVSMSLVRLERRLRDARYRLERYDVSKAMTQWWLFCAIVALALVWLQRTMATTPQVSTRLLAAGVTGLAILGVGTI